MSDHFCPHCGEPYDRCACESNPLNRGNLRTLNLTWGEHERGGVPHVEWHAPCGCAYHPEPKPHVHTCEAHQ